MASTLSSNGLSERRKTTLQAIKSYDDWKIEEILAWRSEKCTHEILPKSLNQPTMSNTLYKAYFSGIMPFFRDFKLQINDIIEDEKENKIVIWAQSTAVTDLGPYANEYMLVLYFNESGEKVDRFLEFVDSASSRESMVALMKYIAEKQAEKEE
ncbi:hypothetical protein BGZ60DRAFT_397154 [Tricladium varicosporioides]|nr:hypothetical protein BGZ60DRAFT_397154 [Hymenoscyphus varicosporioides]